MTIATVSDVQRWLRAMDQDISSEVTPLLEAAEEWVREYLGRDLDVQGTVTEKFNNVRWDAILILRDRTPTNVAVAVFRSAASVGEQLTPNQSFQVLKEGKVQLLYRGLGLIGPGSPAQFDTPIWAQSRIVGTYDRVEVTYTASAHVPKPVREATALIAASWYTQQESSVSDVVSERLGDYSYSRASGQADAQGVPDRAIAWLRPFKAPKVRTV
jgi:hypothetical protein